MPAAAHPLTPGCLPAAPSPPAPASVRDADGACLKVFQAHSAAVLSIVQTGARTYSLAADGCLKGWSSAVPHPADIDAL